MQQLQNLLAGVRVQIAGRFIGPAGSAGKILSARAIATRCRSPPQSSSGECSIRAFSCTSSSNSRARSSIFTGPAAQVRQRRNVSRLVSVGSKLKNWKMEMILSRRTRVSPSSLSVDNVSPFDLDLAFGGTIQAANQIQRRRLSGADGPMVSTISPRPYVEVQPLERRHVALTFKLFRKHPRN